MAKLGCFSDLLQSEVAQVYLVFFVQLTVNGRTRTHTLIEFASLAISATCEAGPSFKQKTQNNRRRVLPEYLTSEGTAERRSSR